MNSVSHLLNIGTLATWLSVAGFSLLGGIFQRWHSEPGVAEQAEPTVLVEDFQLGNEGAKNAEQLAAADPPQEFPPGIQPAPPELPALSDQDPLPAVPDFPGPSQSPARPQTKVRPAAAGNASASTRNASARGNTSPAGGSSNSARLAAGRMPPPSYPPLARRNGQTGTVMVEFTVDGGGRVISAHAKSSSGWALLDREAVRTVLRWRFPPGGVMKLQRPIVFQLR